MKFKWTLRLTLLTPLIMLISIVTAGGGHGTQVGLLLFYPVCLLFDGDVEPFVWMILIGQFPIYGLIVDIGIRISKESLAVGLVVLFHTILILIKVSDSEFWKHLK